MDNWLAKALIGNCSWRVKNTIHAFFCLPILHVAHIVRNMNIDITPNDDIAVLLNIRDTAEQLRKQLPPASAYTAAKIELLLSRCIETAQHDTKNEEVTK